MSRWSEVEAADPALATDIRAAFAIGKHCTIATLRADGAPRISGTEVEFEDGDIFIGSGGHARKTGDILRDPRVAIHSQGRDPDADDEWPGEAKFSGIAVEVATPAHYPPGGRRFRIDLTSAVFTDTTEEQPPRLRIRLWRAGRGTQTMFAS